MPRKKIRIKITFDLDISFAPDKHTLWQFMLHNINDVFVSKWSKLYPKIRNVQITIPKDDNKSSSRY